MFSIRTKMVLLLLPITLLLAALGYANYFKTTELFTQSAEKYLRTIVKTKERALIEYILSTEKIGSAIAATEIVQTYSELANRNLSGNNQETVEKLGRRVEDLLYSFQETHWGRYHRIFLINRTNRIVISPDHGVMEKGSPSSLLNQDMSTNRWAMGAMEKGVTMVSDYSNWQASDDRGQMLFFPVRDASNRVQAVIGFELQVSYEQQIVSEGVSLGENGRIYLVTGKGVPLSPRTGESQAPLTGIALGQAKLTGASSERRLNAQGREVIALYARHLRYPWVLVAEIEVDEVIGTLHELQIMLIAGLLGTLVVVMILSLIFANAIVKPIRALTSQLERISLGEFSIEIPDSRRRDEIGKLNQALQGLVFSLQLVSKKLRQAKMLKAKILRAKAMRKAG